MASRTLPGLGLQGFWTLGEAWKTGGDTNWLTLSVMAQLVVESATANLPASPANGVVYIVNAAGGGNAAKVAVRDAGAWVYLVPPLGAMAWVKDAAGTDKRYRFDGTTWVVEHPVLTPYREQLTAARTYYVRTNGSDSNNGLANTAAGAFLTIQKAVDVASSLDLATFDVTINVAAGTYTAGAIFKSFVGSGRINIVGAGSTTIIAQNVAGSIFGDTTTSGHDGIYSVSNMRLAPTVSGCFGIDCPFGFAGQVVFGGIDFGPMPSGQHIRAGRGAIVTNAGNPYTISGGALSHIYCADGGQVRVQNTTVTITAAAAFNPFITADRGGTVLVTGMAWTGIANVTGKSFDAVKGGGLLYGGATLPGNAAGTTTAPGWSA